MNNNDKQYYPKFNPFIQKPPVVKFTKKPRLCYGVRRITHFSSSTSNITEVVVTLFAKNSRSTGERCRLLYNTYEVLRFLFQNYITSLPPPSLSNLEHNKFISNQHTWYCLREYSRYQNLTCLFPAVTKQLPFSANDTARTFAEILLDATFRRNNVGNIK